MLWFLPSFYGDVRLERRGDSTLVIVEKVTLAEKQALENLSRTAIKKGWATDPVSPRGKTLLGAPIDKVSKLLSKLLKPGRKLVTAVRFADGKLEELQEAPLPAGSTTPTAGGPYREPGQPPQTTLAEPPTLSPPALPAKPEPKKAVTVAAPTRGCPAPNFPPAELRAREVLEHFLSADQIADFRRYNRFITVGGTTGYRYMVTSRHARDQLSTFQRTLYDLDNQVALCVHDWSVPAAEEMLALHILVQLPGYEGYLRYLEE